jgi:hypothetical protein
MDMANIYSLSNHEMKVDGQRSEDSHVAENSIDERKLIRKIDLHIIPWLALLYLLNFLDRGSIGNAKVRFSPFPNKFVAFAYIQSAGVSQLYNLEADIGINDRQYLIALTVFFFPYAILEVCFIFPTTHILLKRLKPASNVLLRRFRPSIYLSTMMLMWGMVMV